MSTGNHFLQSRSMSSLRKLIQAHPLPVLGITVASIFVLRHIRDDYKLWLELGPGGVPQNPFGYVFSYTLSLVASKSLKDTVCYEPLISLTPDRFLVGSDEVPIRNGPAPVVSSWIFPVRQLNARTNAQEIEHIHQHLKDLADIMPNVFLAPSLQEGGHGPGLFIEANRKTNSNEGIKESRQTHYNREVFHCHGIDGSAHATLSPADAKQVLDRGWGERHPLSGKLMLPLNYIMIYAPRNAEEFQIYGRMIGAAVQYGQTKRALGLMHP